MGKGTIKTKAMTMAVAMSMVAGLCPSTVFAANSEDVAKVQDGTYTGTAECTPDGDADFDEYNLSLYVVISDSIKVIFVLLSRAFFLAMDKASLEISRAKMLELGRLCFREMAMHPEPVPISRISMFSFLKYLFIFFRVFSTSNSVSKRGIKTCFDTFIG